MSTTTVESPTPVGQRRRRYILFRVVAVIIALTFIVLFGVWQSIFTPWVTFADGADHGWERTPELHRVADAASALLMGAVAVAALIAAIRPTGRSAVTLWVAGTLSMIGVGSIVSSLIQGHDLVGALIFVAVWFAVVVAPFALLSPDRRSNLRGGVVDAVAGPRRSARAAFGLLGFAGLALAIGVVSWRLTGGLFERAQEDDVVGLTMLGLAIAGGALLCARQRQGWQSLAGVLAGMVAYATVAGISIALL